VSLLKKVDVVSDVILMQVDDAGIIF